jgi:hypothetical protein
MTTDLTKITTPFLLLDEETRFALMAHGGPIEYYMGGSIWCDAPFPTWADTVVFRAKPQPPTKPSIDWSHVAKEYKWLARDAGEPNGFLYDEEPHPTLYGQWQCEGMCINATVFASYTPGICDWRDSLVERPDDA